MDKKAIRKALDHFENDEYVDAKDIIAKEIQGKRDIFIQHKTELKNPINPIVEPKEDDGIKDDGIDNEDIGEE